MTPRAYEDAVAKLIGRLVSGVELVPPGIQQRQKLTGKTGQAYEIDLLYRYRLGGLEYLTIVECKHWKERVGVDIVNQLYSIQQDVGAHKAAVVTTRGFQKGAITVASKNGIALICFIRGTPQFLTYLDGGWSEICKLIESDNSSPHPPDSSIGVVFPTRSPRRYIANRYGMEIAQLLVSDGFLSCDQIPRPELRETVERQIRRMDLSWVIEYENEERAGLPVDVGSRSELRMMNTKVAMLLREVGFTNEELLTQLEEMKVKAGAIGSCPTKEDQHIHYLDRIRTSLKSEIVIRFMLNVGSPIGFLERQWGEALMSGLDHLVSKVAVAIIEGGIWSDQATNSDIDKASARLIEEAMQELYDSSPEELANGGSDSFKNWLSEPLVATKESDSTEP